MKQYQINRLFQMLSDILRRTLYELHVLAHTFLLRQLRGALDHLTRKIAQQHLMS